MAADAERDLQLEVGHVLLIDIVGYTKLLITEQREQLRALNEIVRNTAQFRASDAKGMLVRIPAGDGMALIFRDTVEAPIQCALEISAAVKIYPEIHLRMGIHSGPVSDVTDVNERANIAGAGIDLAQRVMDCADAGHILLSKHVADDLAPYPRWNRHLHDLGECEVKHGRKIFLVNFYTAELGNPQLPEKLKRAQQEEARKAFGAASRLPPTLRRKHVLIAAGALLGVMVVTGFWFYSRQAIVTSSRPEKSIALLPFENLSEEKANAYFAEGVQDEILTRLAAVRDLKVISRTSTAKYQSKPDNLKKVAQELGVSTILEGAVQKAGDKVRVNVQLIDARADTHLWAETFDRKLTDIFSVESEVAKAIADRLQAKLTGAEEQVLDAKPTENAEAYDAYLRGLAYSQKTANTTANTLSAQKYLKEAVRLGPKFALGWALLSYVDAVGYRTEFLQPTVALREEVRQAAETALTLQPNLGEAVLAKGFYHYACLRDYETALRYFEEARPLLPNSSRIPELLAYVTRRQGQWDRSESYFNEAERLDPRNVSLLTQHALSYKDRRLFPEALRKLEQILNITPDDVDTIIEKAVIAQAQGDLPRASAILAPLHLQANNPNALETQIYQAILERRPAPIIARLKEILAKPDPALGSTNGELRFWLGCSHVVDGAPT